MQPFRRTHEDLSGEKGHIVLCCYWENFERLCFPQDDWLAKQRNIQALPTELYLGRGREGGLGGKTFRCAGGGRTRTGQGANGTV